MPMPSLGSNWGGVLTIIAHSVTFYLLIYGVIEMFSGGKDIINRIVHANDFKGENQQIRILDTNFMPSFAVHIQNNDSVILKKYKAKGILDSNGQFDLVTLQNYFEM